MKLFIPVIIFDCEVRGRLLRSEFSRLVPNDSHGLDDRVAREDVAKYLHNSGDNRTTQFEHSNIRTKFKELATDSEFELDQ